MDKETTTWFLAEDLQRSGKYWSQVYQQMDENIYFLLTHGGIAIQGDIHKGAGIKTEDK